MASDAVLGTLPSVCFAAGLGTCSQAPAFCEQSRACGSTPGKSGLNPVQAPAGGFGRAGCAEALCRGQVPAWQRAAGQRRVLVWSSPRPALPHCGSCPLRPPTPMAPPQQELELGRAQLRAVGCGRVLAWDTASLFGAE